MDREQELSNKNAELDEMIRLADERESELDREKQEYRARMNKANESRLLRKEHELYRRYKMQFSQKMSELDLDIKEFKKWYKTQRLTEQTTDPTKMNGIDNELDEQQQYRR